MSGDVHHSLRRLGQMLELRRDQKITSAAVVLSKEAEFTAENVVTDRLSSATPAAVGSATAGTGTTVSRADHVHAHGTQAGGTLHSEATTSTAGFLSTADKTLLTGTKTANTLFAGPESGSAAAPAFRALVAADLPQAPGFSVHKDGAGQSVAYATWTKVTWGTEAYDTTSAFASDRFTVALAGAYVSHCNITWNDWYPKETLLFTALYKNGSLYRVSRIYPNVSGSGIFPELPNLVIDKATAGDYYEIYVLQYGSNPSHEILGAAANTNWTVQWIGR